MRSCQAPPIWKFGWRLISPCRKKEGGCPLCKLEQSWDKIVSTLFQRCFNVAHWRCINVVQRWKSDLGFCFIFNVGSKLFQCWSTTLKQPWSDVEILAWSGLQVFSSHHNCVLSYHIFVLFYKFLQNFIKFYKII